MQMENTIKSKRNQNKNIYQHGTYNLETVSEETFEMRITGEPKEPNLESFSLTWSANHSSIYNSSRPYRMVILQPVHLSGIRQSVRVLPSPPLPREDILSCRYLQWKERLVGVVVLRSKAKFWIFYRYQLILFFSLGLTK